MTMSMLGLQAQTDYTSEIVNPSFEQGMTGWIYKSLGVQGNDIFTLKAGSNYVEKWTGRGGAVGSASVSQQLSSLPPGNYELSVAAQNIQEDTPTAAQTGAYIFAGTAKTTVTVRGTYKVAFNYISGTVTIGFEAVNASGNWIALDNFKLTQVGTDLSTPLNEAITAAETLYGDGSGRQASQLKTAIDAAHAVANAQATAQQQAAACTKGKEVNALTEQARTEGMMFLSNVAASDLENPFDLTFMLENPDFDTDVSTGWTSTNGAPGYDAQGAEFYEKTFDFYQTLEQMPAGTYQLRANAFQRPGSSDNVFSPYKAGTAKVTTSLYINSTSEPICHICDDRQPSPLLNDGGWGSDRQMSDGTYIPNCMVGAEKYFAKRLYDSRVSAEVTTAGNSLRIGLKCTNAPTYYWTMFDHFRLFFFGQNDAPVGIDDVQIATTPQGTDVIYDLSGRRITSRHQLKRGIYIINGKKAVR